MIIIKTSDFDILVEVWRFLYKKDEENILLLYFTYLIVYHSTSVLSLVLETY